MTHGKLIVIEGSDGSGKATQTKLLAERIGQDVATFAFPRYGMPAAHLLQRYLGRNMDRYARTLTPYQASFTYAADRLDWAVTEGYALLESGANVLLDRYVLSNLAHQGARIPNFEMRRLFYDWCLGFEFMDLQLPRPDLTVLLHVASEVSIALIEKRGATTDAHEADHSHLRAAEAAYLELADLLPGLGHKVRVVECMRNPDMSPEDIRTALADGGIGAVLLTEAEIHECVWEAVQPTILAS